MLSERLGLLIHSASGGAKKSAVERKVFEKYLNKIPGPSSVPIVIPAWIKVC